MTTGAKPVPCDYHSVTPCLSIRDADKALDFYKRAFGAQERRRFTSPDGNSIMHAELKIGDSILFMGEERPLWGAEGRKR